MSSIKVVRKPAGGGKYSENANLGLHLEDTSSCIYFRPIPQLSSCFFGYNLA